MNPSLRIALKSPVIYYEEKTLSTESSSTRVVSLLPEVVTV